MNRAPRSDHGSPPGIAFDPAGRWGSDARSPARGITALGICLLQAASADPVRLASVAATPAAVAAEQQPPFDTGLFTTDGDFVHISTSNPGGPRGASGHGWWYVNPGVVGEAPTEADVTVQLQINLNGTWVDAGEPGRERTRPGTGGSANRANAFVPC
ncbi:MAG TPA: hypothetical protein DEQ61_07315 [Streptomyces sp.]|nr:hypothetical protein [Streptomyces sp.]